MERSSIIELINKFEPEIQEWILEVHGDYQTFADALIKKGLLGEEEFTRMKRIAERVTGKGQKAILLRFGVIDGKGETINEVCEITGLSRDEIRRLESIWMRHDQRRRTVRLRDYLD